jgi:hypothetical protein
MKKTNKTMRGISFLQVICLTLLVAASGLLSANAQTQSETFTDAAQFACGADGVITAYNGDKAVTQLVVPQTIGGVVVQGIGDNVFAECTKLQTIYLPNAVTGLGNNAFGGCESLTTMRGYDAEDVQADGSLSVKDHQSGLLWLPSSLATMGTGVFAGCKAIGKFAIATANTAFKTATWDSSSAVVMGTDASGNPCSLAVEQGEMLLSKDGTVLYRFAPAFHYTGQGLYALPEGIVTIASYALEAVGLNGGFTIPTSCTAIGDYAFYGCGNLNSMEYAAPSQLQTIGAYAFANNANLHTTLPASVTTIGVYSFAYCSNIVIDVSATALTQIPEYAFYDCNNLHELTLPATVTTIEAYAFSQCDNLNTVKFAGTTLSKIGAAVFQGCPNLHEITIPEGVTAIEDNTFDGCQNLNTIILPDSLKSIGDSAFKDCSNIHTMVIPKGVTYIAKNSFTGAKQDEIDTTKNTYSQKFIKGALPEAGETFTIGNYKYTVTKSDASKGTVTLSGVTTKKLKNAEVAATVAYRGYTFRITAIGDKAFAKCKKLTKVTVGANVKKIGKSAFDGDKKLKTLVLQSTSITSIGKNAFRKTVKKMKVTLAKKKYRKYKKMLKKAGVNRRAKYKFGTGR